jgi:CheY-like chemotaxis protein
VTFEVADSGMGVPADRLNDIFDKFAQVDASSTRRFGGTGLGLAICRELVRRMGGEIAVESRLGDGSTFRFRLPLPRAAAAEAPAAGAAPDAIGAGTIRVLAADDNEINRQIVAALLEPFGLELTLANDGREALEAFGGGAFDLVLMDIQMPGMNGLEATRLIRALEAREGRPRTPVLALSANVMTHQVTEYMTSGFDGVVAKPIQAERLVAAINAALAEAPAQEARHGAAGA